ncbi:MAG: class III poly(R)-hydroxyalkanoic acid synthase subunit PhaC, partial [Candidatus Dadabacteria bacterium]
NKLIKGEVEIGGRRVDLKNITMPVLNIFANEDHLVPPSSSKALEKYVGTKDFTTLSFPGGHIGIYVSSRSQRELAPTIAKWVKERV